jgi:primosomal replication protein N
MRYTPAGVPALNFLLEHESQVLEIGVPRTVKVVVKAVAFGVWKFSGFLANARQGKTVVFHVQEFLQD